MAKRGFKGEVKARIAELRFAFSGKVAFVAKKKGDPVKKGEAIAGLDKKTLQAELDRQLADFEKTRAEFEIFHLQKSEPLDEISKHLKSQKQASLNSSVKEVEMAKARMDLADLVSPVEGVIVEDSDITPGINITPASSPIKVLHTSSYFFEFEISQEELPLFLEPVEMKIKIPAVEKELFGTSKKAFPSFEKKPGKFSVRVELKETSLLFFGMEGEAMFGKDITE